MIFEFLAHIVFFLLHFVIDKFKLPYFYQNFYQQKNIERIRTNIVNREWYEKEFDKIFIL